MANICPVCHKEVEIQHTPAIDKATGNRAHDYCLRVETPQHSYLRMARRNAEFLSMEEPVPPNPEYSVASELDADEWDAEYRRSRHVEPEDLL